MEYLTTKQFSNIWNISERRIIKLCGESRIDGAIKNGKVWLIPENTNKPTDKRSNISKYINTQKKVLIINIENNICEELIPLLVKQGYIVEGISKNRINLNNIKSYVIDFENDIDKVVKNTDKYYNGLIIIDTDYKINNKELLIKKISEKLDFESGIVLVNDLENLKEKLEKKLCESLLKNIGVRINSLNITYSAKDNVIFNYSEIANDILDMLTGYKNTTGICINTDGGAIKLNKDQKTEKLCVGNFYRTINQCFKNLNKESYLWCASTMMEDEWTEEPLEMKFRLINLEAANRGVKIDRIFIFSKNRINEFKNNKTLKIYMQSNINTLFVDYDDILKNEPNLLKELKDGWDGINKDTLIVDIANDSKYRGYISKNSKEIEKAYKCFQKLKTYAKNLKEVLK